MIKELYLPIAEAAEAAKCTVRALLQRGAENTLPIYVQLNDFSYFNIVLTEHVPDRSEPVQAVLPNDHVVESLTNPLNGRFRASPFCLGTFLLNPEKARLLPEHYQYDEEWQVKKQWVFYSMTGPWLKDAALLVMTDDLKKAGLLPDDTLTSLLEFVDDPRWPVELDIAVMAWQAASKELGVDDRPKEFIVKWLESTFPQLKHDQVRRISTIANWNKKSGRPSDN